MPEPVRPQTNPPALRNAAPSWAKSAILGCLVILGALSGFGCGREFFREWADQDVTEAVFEKTRDPRWRQPVFTVDPPAMSRFADYSDPDRPPAPPDDPSTEALSPYPQKPHMRLIVPMEGTGYIDILEKGPRYEEPRDLPRGGDPAVSDLPMVGGAELPEPSRDDSPFNDQPINDPNSPPNGRSVPPPPEPGTPAGNSGARREHMTPNALGAPVTAGRPNLAVPARGSVGSATRASAAAPPRSQRLVVRDPDLLAATFQVPDTGGNALPGAGQPGQDAVRPSVPPGDFQLPPPATEFFQNPMDESQLFQQQDRAEIARGLAADFDRLARMLSNIAVTTSQSEDAGLPIGSRPYIVDPANALQLALTNSRGYQFLLEQVYITSLAVTLARFNFEPQFFAGMNPSTQTAGGLPFTGSGNQFTYRTQAFGSQQSQLTLSEAAGFGKLFTYGGRLAMGFASSTVFNFVGSNPRQPAVQSSLPIQFVQPFLRGAGRAVIMEPLTQAERNLLYEVRNFARARQQFFASVLTNQQAPAAGGPADPNPGYLGVLSQIQQIENQRVTLASFQQALPFVEGYARDPRGQSVRYLQILQIQQNIQDTQVSLINSQIQYRNTLDQYKQQLGLPPDLPMVLDLGPIDGFRSVTRELLKWQAAPGHEPRQLNNILLGLPSLESIILDGRPLFVYGRRVPMLIVGLGFFSEFEDPNPATGRWRIDIRTGRPYAETLGPPGILQRYANSERLEEFLIVAERIALENRLDLMNQRGQLYDAWRQLAVISNSLLPIFNVNLNYQLLTPITTTNPFGFDSQSNLTQLSFNTELPLIRVAERNNFRQALITFQRTRRQLMFQEDAIKNQIRAGVRNLIFLSQSYEVAKTVLKNTLLQRDYNLGEIFDSILDNRDIAVTVINFITAVQGVLTQLNNLVTRWVAFETARIALYRDLGTMPYDEWEAFYELFPQAASRRNDGAGPG